MINPITLPLSQISPNLSPTNFLNSITALIAYVRAAKQIGVSRIVSSLIDGSRYGKVDFGIGMIRTTELDTLNERALSRTSTLTDVILPPIGQENLNIDTYRVIQVSVSEPLARQSGVTGMEVDSILSLILGLLQSTATHNQYDRIVNLINNWTPRATQIVTVDIEDTSTLTGADLNQAEIRNARQIYKAMQLQRNIMETRQSGYTDTGFENYTAQDGTTVLPVRTALESASMRLIMNDKYLTDMKADGLANHYNKSFLEEMEKSERLDIIPNSKLTNGKTIGILCHQDKFALLDFYHLQHAFFDPSTLYTNYFLHYAFGMGVFGLAPAIMFVASN
jgi:hypothetical protein